MQRYFHERGRSHMEALEKIRDKYGDNFRILTQKSVPAPGIMGLFGKEQVEYSGYVLAGKEARDVQKSRDEQNRAAILAAAGKEPVNTKKDDDIGEVLKELKNLQSRLAIAASTPPPEPYPFLSEIAEILKKNDFDQTFITGLTDRLRNEFTAAELDDRSKMHNATATIIADRLDCSRPDRNGVSRVFVLVGPTGVGKTTTIAKLAAVHGLSGVTRDVRIITVDSFRIGARAQVETYGEIMGIPVKAVDDHDDLKAQIALAADADLVLVDTIGKSPRDRERIEEMRWLLSACGNDSVVHLAVSATTKTADLREILTQFEPFEYRSVIMTKLDETSRVGNILSVLFEAGASMSYLTDGQSVPVDIAVASPDRILGMIRGLDFDPILIEQRYTAADLTPDWS